MRRRTLIVTRSSSPRPRHRIDDKSSTWDWTTTRGRRAGTDAWRWRLILTSLLLCHGPWRCHGFYGSNPRIAFRSLQHQMHPPESQVSSRRASTFRSNVQRAIVRVGRPPPRSLVRRRSRNEDDETPGSYYWEGDDRRMWTRWMRQFRFSRTRQFENRPGQTTIVGTLVVFYLYQVATTLAWMRSKFPAEWAAHWFRILIDVGMGTALPGPLLQRGGMKTMATMTTAQPHRYLLSGLLHGSILHWLLDVHTLSSRRRIPAWVETGLGSRLFATTFVASVVAGNVALSRFGAPGSDRLAFSVPSYLCGASGGICGLHGLHIVSLIRMRSKGQGDGLGRAMRSLLWTMLYGYFIPEVALVGSVGGLVCGALMGILFGPRYSSSYAMKRKWSTEVDVYSRDYRRAMGFGIQPRRPLLPLAYFWAGVALLMASVPSLRSVPRAIWEVMTLVKG